MKAISSAKASTFSRLCLSIFPKRRVANGCTTKINKKADMGFPCVRPLITCAPLLRSPAKLE